MIIYLIELQKKKSTHTCYIIILHIVMYLTYVDLCADYMFERCILIKINDETKNIFPRINI